MPALVPKPGLWVANAASVDPYWREFWQDLFIFIPFHGDPGEDVQPFAEMAAFGPGASQLSPFWNHATATRASWVNSPVGPGLNWGTSIEANNGVEVTAGTNMFRMHDSFPCAVAILFEYDGADLSEQRALISQGGNTGFRFRIENDAEPHSMNSAVLIPDIVWDNELMLVVLWSNPANNPDRFDLIWQNYGTHPEEADFLGNIDMFGLPADGFPLLVGTQASNDQSDGITIYGFWAWGGSANPERGEFWTEDKAWKFAEDPFGMYRRAAVGVEAPAVAALPPASRQQVYHQPRRRRESQVFA